MRECVRRFIINQQGNLLAMAIRILVGMFSLIEFRFLVEFFHSPFRVSFNTSSVVLLRDPEKSTFN